MIGNFIDYSEIILAVVQYKIGINELGIGKSKPERITNREL